MDRRYWGRTPFSCSNGAGWHGSKALCIPKNITLLLLAPYAPEPTDSENILFRPRLRQPSLAISVFETYDKKCDVARLELLRGRMK